MTKKIMKKAVTLFLVLLVITSVFAFSLPAFAAGSNVWSQTGGSGDVFANNAGLGNADLVETITNLIKIIIGFLGLIAVVIVLIGGFKWMTAGGSEDKIGEAKKLIIAGVIGLVIILFSYAIAAFVLSTITNAGGV